jgi:hypothetical protein
MTLQQDIIEGLQQRLKYAKESRSAILDQVKLKDVSIDKIDVLIGNIDKKISPLLKNINDKIDELKSAYDARIANGCRNDLRWEIVASNTNFRTSTSYTTYKCVKDSSLRQQKNYYGQKYYRKPLNRDFGSNLITELTGNIGVSSNILAVVSAGGTEGINIGDTVTDNLDAPEIFLLGQLPTVVGFVSTSTVGFTTTLVGNIGVGSDRFVNVGIGTTLAAPIGSAVSFTGVLPEGTTVIGIGTADTTVEFYDEPSGTTSNVTVTAPALILSNVATAATTNGTLHVGIGSTVPSLILSQNSNTESYNGLFSVIRSTEDIDSDFDFEKSPLDPVTVGILGSQAGIGHKTVIVNNGAPQGPAQWKEQQQNPEPSIGAGNVVYYTGNTSWPIIKTGAGILTVVTYATEGRVLVSASSTLGTSATATVTSISPLNPSASTCNTSDSAISSAETALTDAINANISELQRLNDLSSSLREVRDKMELEAYGMLQGASYEKSEVNKIQNQINSISESNLSEFEP